MGGRSRSKTKKRATRSFNSKTRSKREEKIYSNDFRAKKISCAPKKYEELNMFSCFTDDSLIKLKNAWNSKNPNNKIVVTDGDMIHKELSMKMKNICETEACWVDKLLENNATLAAEINEKSFAPTQPESWSQNPNEWLSSEEISHVMKQYERAYKNFKFIGPSPIDFDKKVSKSTCVWDSLCHFNISDYLKQGKDKIGFIFNTDPHTKGGKHWISMFLNLKKGEIFFFDSVGNTAPKQIKTFVDRVIKQGAKLGKQFKYDENHPVEHQYGDTECGIYSLFFIVHMLQDKINQEYLKTHIIKDKYMEAFREKYFNKNGRRKGGSRKKRVRKRRTIKK